MLRLYEQMHARGYLRVMPPKMQKCVRLRLFPRDAINSALSPAHGVQAVLHTARRAVREVQQVFLLDAFSSPACQAARRRKRYARQCAKGIYM